MTLVPPIPDTAFISGAARSGTTALAYLLNLHPQLAFGIERFKFTILRQKNPQPDMFSSDRFFTFDENETNITPDAAEQFAAQYDRLRPKFDTVTVVGDKIPNLANWYRRLDKIFPGVRFIHLVREPVAVGRSWDGRAANSDDPQWNSAAKAPRGVERWLHENNSALQFRTGSPEQIRIVSYEAMFSSDPTALDLLLQFLGVEPATDEMHHARLEGAQRTKGKRFDDLGPQPEGVSDELWQDVVEMMRRLHNQVTPRIGGFLKPPPAT